MCLFETTEYFKGSSGSFVNTIHTYMYSTYTYMYTYAYHTHVYTAHTPISTCTVHACIIVILSIFNALELLAQTAAPKDLRPTLYPSPW